MFIRSLVIKSMLITAATSAFADTALAANLKTAVAVCEPGAAARQSENQHQSSWETQLALPGVVTVSAFEARCLMNELGKELVVVAAVSDSTRLPGAVPMAWAAGSGSDVQDRLASELATLTNGRKTRPLLVYCHSTSCELSPAVAKRMVQAGYEQVYWLRSGMSGWRSAGLAFEGGVEQDPAKRFADAVASCDVELTPERLAATVVGHPQHELEDALAKRLADAQTSRKTCLQQVRYKAVMNHKRKTDLAQMVARSDAELARAMKAARTAFNANPAAELLPLISDADAPDLSEMLSRASSVRSLTSLCGNFDFTIPYLDDAALERIGQRLEAYAACMDKVPKSASGVFVFDTPIVSPSEFERAVELAERTRPYTCAEMRRPNCVPDEAWSQLGSVATRDALRTVQSADRTLDQNRVELASTIERLQRYVASVNARVTEIQEEEEEDDDDGDSSYAYPSNSYSPTPPPTPYRRPSDTSAAGIR